MGTEIGSSKKIRDQNKIPWTIFANRSSRTCKTLSSLCSLHHIIESHILVSLQLQCTRNGKRTIQLPELNPGPAGPETHLEYQTKVEALGEHSTTRCFFFFLDFLTSISPRWTLVSLILSFSQHLKYFTDIILEALGLFDWCSHDCVVCCNELPTSQLDDSMGNDGCKDLTI